MPFVQKLFRVLKKLFKRRRHRRKKRSRSPSRRPRRRPRTKSRPGVVRKKKASIPPVLPRSKTKPGPLPRMAASAVRKPQQSSRTAPRTLSAHAGAVLPRPAEPILVPAGAVTHYFSKIMVCVVKISGQGLSVGDRIKIKGTRTDFLQKVSSLQIESVNVPSARKGQLVGLKVDQVCCVGDQVFRVFPGKG